MLFSCTFILAGVSYYLYNDYRKTGNFTNSAKHVTRSPKTTNLILNDNVGSLAANPVAREFTQILPDPPIPGTTPLTNNLPLILDDVEIRIGTDGIFSTPELSEKWLRGQFVSRLQPEDMAIKDWNHQALPPKQRGIMKYHRDVLFGRKLSVGTDSSGPTETRHPFHRKRHTTFNSARDDAHDRPGLEQKKRIFEQTNLSPEEVPEQIFNTQGNKTGTFSSPFPDSKEPTEFRIGNRGNHVYTDRALPGNLPQNHAPKVSAPTPFPAPIPGNQGAGFETNRTGKFPGASANDTPRETIEFGPRPGVRPIPRTTESPGTITTSSATTPVAPRLPKELQSGGNTATTDSPGSTSNPNTSRPERIPAPPLPAGTQPPLPAWSPPVAIGTGATISAGTSGSIPQTGGNSGLPRSPAVPGEHGSIPATSGGGSIPEFPESAVNSIPVDSTTSRPGGNPLSKLPDAPKPGGSVSNSQPVSPDTPSGPLPNPAPAGPGSGGFPPYTPGPGVSGPNASSQNPTLNDNEIPDVPVPPIPGGAVGGAPAVPIGPIAGGVVGGAIVPFLPSTSLPPPPLLSPLPDIGTPPNIPSLPAQGGGDNPDITTIPNSGGTGKPNIPINSSSGGGGSGTNPSNSPTTTVPSSPTGGTPADPSPPLPGAGNVPQPRPGGGGTPKPSTPGTGGGAIPPYNPGDGGNASPTTSSPLPPIVPIPPIAGGGGPGAPIVPIIGGGAGGIIVPTTPTISIPSLPTSGGSGVTSTPSTPPSHPTPGGSGNIPPSNPGGGGTSTPSPAVPTPGGGGGTPSSSTPSLPTIPGTGEIPPYNPGGGANPSQPASPSLPPILPIPPVAGGGGAGAPIVPIIGGGAGGIIIPTTPTITIPSLPTSGGGGSIPPFNPAGGGGASTPSTPPSLPTPGGGGSIPPFNPGGGGGITVPPVPLPPIAGGAAGGAPLPPVAGGGGAGTAIIPIPPIAGAGGPGTIPPDIPPPSTQPEEPGSDKDPRLKNLICIFWQVQRGQTIESLAASVGASPADIREINGITSIRPGQTIRLPIKAPVPCCE